MGGENGVIDPQHAAAAGGGGGAAEPPCVDEAIPEGQSCMIGNACASGLFAKPLAVAGETDHSALYGIVGVLALGIDAADSAVIGHDANVCGTLVGDIAAVDGGVMGGNPLAVLYIDGGSHLRACAHGRRSAHFVFDAVFFKPVPGLNGNIGNSRYEGKCFASELCHRKNLLSEIVRMPAKSIIPKEWYELQVSFCAASSRCDSAKNGTENRDGEFPVPVLRELHGNGKGLRAGLCELRGEAGGHGPN